MEIGVEKDGNADMCCLCGQGGSLLCCDRCPASYHMRCIGEHAKSLPQGEWACPECALGGRGGHPSFFCAVEGNAICRPLNPCMLSRPA